MSEISARGVNRRSFLKTAAILGGGAPLLSACGGL
ncbi:twin-arginine translocation signal domain-containing protein, partial [Micromonospora aurantiaca]|nr:twin-arginine translocation signal domain-containing protein [Micromonospora aurantiaca]